MAEPRAALEHRLTGSMGAQAAAGAASPLPLAPGRQPPVPH